MKAPFPYFGGKSRIAPIVWRALGQPKTYLEPFFGSGAVLLNRPGYDPSLSEIVCDKDGFIANVWRSIQFAPDEVARWCDWPINHADLRARRKALLANEGRLLENLCADPDWYDAKLAGFWVWAASCWIGAGLTCTDAIPEVRDNKGITGQRPSVRDNKGITGQRPQLTITNGVNASRNGAVYAWMAELSARLRYVKVVCGDWTRICGGDWQDDIGVCGIFFDPPYTAKGRDANLYHHESTTVAAKVNAWALKRGARQSHRIVIAGYEEHENLLDHGWTKQGWKANGGYANQGKRKGENARRETLYFSPHCLINQERLAL